MIMILFTICAILLLVLAVVVALALGVGGLTIFIVFGDVIVFGLVIALIIRLFKKRKK